MYVCGVFAEVGGEAVGRGLSKVTRERLEAGVADPGAYKGKMRHGGQVSLVNRDRRAELGRVASHLRDRGWEGEDEEVVGWYERGEPDGVSWDGLRERWDGGLARLEFGESGGYDVNARVLAMAEVLMGVGMNSLRNVELYDAAGTRVEVLYTRGGVPVEVGGLRPGSFREAAQVMLGAAKVAQDSSAALEKLVGAEDERKRMLAGVAMAVLERLELSEEQREALVGMLEEEGVAVEGAGYEEVVEGAGPC